MFLIISFLVLRARYGIWLYQFRIIAYRFTLFLYIYSYEVLCWHMKKTLLAANNDSLTINDCFHVVPIVLASNQTYKVDFKKKIKRQWAGTDKIEFHFLPEHKHGLQ